MTSYNGRTAVVARLLAAGADVAAKDGPGSTMLAGYRGHASVTTHLLNAGAGVDDATRKAGHADVVGVLPGAGAQLEAVDSTGRTALVWARGSGCEAVVEQLLAAGASVQPCPPATEATGTTPARIRAPGLTLRRKAKASRADARQRTLDSSLAARFSDVFSILSSDSSDGAGVEHFAVVGGGKGKEPITRTGGGTPAVEGTTPARIRAVGLTLRRKAKASRADARQRTLDSSLAARFSDVFSILSSDSSEGTATGAPFPIFNDPPADGGAATLTPKRQRTSTIPQPKASASPAAARLCSKLKPASRVRACPPPAKVEKKVQNARAAGARRGDYTDIFAILSDSDEERPMRMDPQSTPRAPSPPSTAGTQSARAASSDAPAPRSPFADGRDPVVGERKATAGGDDAQNNPVTSPVPPRRQPASSGVSGGPRFNAPPVPKSALADGQCPGAGEQTSSRVGGAGDTPVGSLMPPPPQPASSGKPAAAKPQRAARKKPTAPPKAANDNNSKNKSSSTQNENNGSNGKTDTAGNTNQKKKNSNSNNQSNGGNGDKKRARPAAGAGAPNAKRQRPALPAGPSQPEPAVLPPEGAPPACKTGGAPVEPGGDNLLTASQGRTKLADSPEPAPCGAPAEPSQKTVGDPPTGESQAASSRASRADAPAAGASETRPAHRPLRKPRGKTGKNRSADVRAGSSETKPAVCTSKDGLADPQQAASSQAKPANKLGKLLKRPLKNDEEPSADVQAGSSETKPAVCTNKDGLQDGQEGSSEAKPAGSSTDQALEMPADDDKDSAADAQPTSSQVKPANKVGKAASSQAKPATKLGKLLKKPLKKVGGNPSADVPTGSSETKPADSTGSTNEDPPANPQAASSQAKPATNLGKLLKKPLKKVGGTPSADESAGPSETKPADSAGGTIED
eukprot:gene5979-9176_t